MAQSLSDLRKRDLAGPGAPSARCAQCLLSFLASCSRHKGRSAKVTSRSATYIAGYELLYSGFDSVFIGTPIFWFCARSRWMGSPRRGRQADSPGCCRRIVPGRTRSHRLLIRPDAGEHSDLPIPCAVQIASGFGSSSFLPGCDPVSASRRSSASWQATGCSAARPLTAASSMT